MKIFYSSIKLITFMQKTVDQNVLMSFSSLPSEHALSLCVTCLIYQGVTVNQ